MTRLASALFFVAGVVAQATVNETVLGQLAQAFTEAGYTQLATAAAAIANTTQGKYVLSTITNGNANWTIFAPTDAAFNKPNVTVPDDPNDLASLLSYHVVPGYYANQSLFDKSPNNTILVTFLNDTDQVNLQGGARQVLSARVDGDNIHINNQAGAEVTNITTVMNRFSILAVDSVLVPPGDLTDTAKTNNLTLFNQIIQQAGITDLINDAKGITVFAPSDSAIQSALAELGDQVNNATLITTILQNHVINGTAVYSTLLDDANYTSAAGQALNFRVHNNTVTVYSGKDNAISANVTRRDLLAKNGVIHIVDAVLANTNRDDGAASSAYQSATNAATDSANATPTPTDTGGPVGGDGGDVAMGRFIVGAQQWAVVAGTAVVAAAFGAISL